VDGDRTQVAELGSPDREDALVEDPSLLAGRYRLLEVVGRGGVADVHRAVDELLGREVAVKLVRSDSPDPAAVERFTAEMRTHAGLSHPNLVTVLDAGVTGARPFLVMELVEGRTLAEAVTDELSVEAVASLGADIAAALAHVHAQGVVHRDLKPANVLLGDNGRVALSDFGIARLMEADHGHTVTGFTIGTASYFAPEQVTGSAVTPAADVYALALVLIEAVTGRRVYPGPPAQAALARLQQEPPLPEHLPPAMSALLRRMTATAPQARPAAAEVERVLRLVATGEAGAAAPATRPLAVTAPQPTVVTPAAAGPAPSPGPAPVRRSIHPPRPVGAQGRPLPVSGPRPVQQHPPRGTTWSRWRERLPSPVMTAVVAVLCVIGAVLGAAVVDATLDARTAATAPAGTETGDAPTGGTPTDVQVRLDELDRAVNG
jgi:serine/threonine protein kinase